MKTLNFAILAAFGFLVGTSQPAASATLFQENELSTIAITGEHPALRSMAVAPCEGGVGFCFTTPNWRSDVDGVATFLDTDLRALSVEIRMKDGSAMPTGSISVSGRSYIEPGARNPIVRANVSFDFESGPTREFRYFRNEAGPVQTFTRDFVNVDFTKAIKVDGVTTAMVGGGDPWIAIDKLCFLPTPPPSAVPVPASVWLMPAALFALGTVSRRRAVSA